MSFGKNQAPIAGARLRDARLDDIAHFRAVSCYGS
jgi:hypothetical protein